MTPAEARFEHLARSCGPTVLGYIGARVLPREEAADVLQVVLTTTWRRIHDVPEDDDHALAWIVGVARRELANHRRAAQRRGAATERLAAELAVAPGVEPQGVHPAAEQVREALQALDGEERELLTLTYWDDLTSEQVGVVLGTTAATARKRLQRARDRLASALSHVREREGAVAPAVRAR